MRKVAQQTKKKLPEGSAAATQQQQQQQQPGLMAQHSYQQLMVRSRPAIIMSSSRNKQPQPAPARMHSPPTTTHRSRRRALLLHLLLPCLCRVSTTRHRQRSRAATGRRLRWRTGCAGWIWSRPSARAPTHQQPPASYPSRQGTTCGRPALAVHGVPPTCCAPPSGRLLLTEHTTRMGGRWLLCYVRSLSHRSLC